MSMLDRYRKNLTTRESRVLSVGIVLFVLILLVFLVWLPMHEKLERTRRQVDTIISDFIWMQQQVPLIKSLKSKPASQSPAGNLSLLTLIDQTATRSKVRRYVKQIQPGKEPDSAKVWFDKVSFENWLRWLDSVTAKGVVVESVSITRSTVQPAVNIRMDVARR